MNEFIINLDLLFHNWAKQNGVYYNGYDIVSNPKTAVYRFVIKKKILTCKIIKPHDNTLYNYIIEYNSRKRFKKSGSVTDMYYFLIECLQEIKQEDYTKWVDDKTHFTLVNNIYPTRADR